MVSEKQNTNSEVMVTVFCLTYNHEPYIQQALEGFCKQETDFTFEILVHDDASTDRTADIIREYVERYPTIIRPFFESENQYSQRKPVIPRILFPQARGKYLAWCEGDDFWTDPKKLQRQVEALEQNPGCVACFCNVTKIDINGNNIGYMSSIEKTGIIKSDNYLRYCLYPGGLRTLPFQLSGFVIRADIYARYTSKTPEYRKYFDVGDIPLFLYCGVQGDIYYFKEEMSCYRTGNQYSITGTIHSSREQNRKHYEIEKKALLYFDEYTDRRFHEEAEKGASLRDFIIYKKTHNIKEMLKPEMRTFFRELSTRQKIKELLFGFFPWSETIWIEYLRR